MDYPPALGSVGEQQHMNGVDEISHSCLLQEKIMTDIRNIHTRKGVEITPIGQASQCGRSGKFNVTGKQARRSILPSLLGLCLEMVIAHCRYKKR